MTFKEINIVEPILKAITEKGYAVPTPIQEKAIPVAISGRDLLACAKTGSGKTAAFAIPILQELLSKKTQGKREIKALILTPTRELAIQIDECVADYSKHTSLRHCVVFGGVNQNPQVQKLKQGVDILIATPGRLLDLMNQGFIHLNSVQHFVLDEADRMLDMGFINDIKRVLSKLPVKKQTLFFSATMPAPIVKLSQSMLYKPVKIEIKPEASAIDVIEQYIYFVEKKEKNELLISLVKKAENQSVLVFSRTKHNADRIAQIGRASCRERV